jgi:hypothetical protein
MHRWYFCLIGSGPRPIQMPITQHDSHDRRRGKDQPFERRHSVRCVRTCTARMHIERVIFNVRRWTGCVHPGDALRDEPMNASGQSGGNEVLRSLAAHARIAARALSHARRIQTVREIGELVNHDVRPRSGNSMRQGSGVEYIDHDGLDTGATHTIGFVVRTRRADYMMASIEQQRNQTPADGACRSG